MFILPFYHFVVSFINYPKHAKALREPEFKIVKPVDTAQSSRGQRSIGKLLDCKSSDVLT